jgi:hypothetical protein
MTRRFLLTTLLLLASLPLAAQIPLPHHVLFVDGVHGNDNNNCKTRKTACKTIGHAISLASPDDAILVAPAIYYENLTINFNLGLIGAGASTTIIDGSQGETAVLTVPNEGTRFVLAGFTIRGGEAYYEDDGGGIANYSGIVTIFDTVVRENVNAFGAGIYNGGTLALNRVTVTDNKAYGDYFGEGAGIFSEGTLTISESTISGNFSVTTDMSGGGICSGGTLIINRSTISGNNTGGGYGAGGGLDIWGTAVLNNSTVYGNSTAGGGSGGGIAVYSGTLTLNNTTIFGNSAGYAVDGGGIYNYEGSVIIQDSILADNVDGNCSGTATSSGYNLSSDSTCNFNGPGDLNNTEPKLGPLQNNGGPTQTMSEALSSPTVDAGNPSGCTDGQGRLLTTDQRGAPRPGKNKHDKRCDMGAFERQTD